MLFISEKAIHMKTTRIFLRLALLCAAGATLMACDPTYNVEYVVDNSSGQPVSIYTNYLAGVRNDTNHIAPGAKLTLYVEQGRGVQTWRFMNNMDALPFTIEIYNRQGQAVIRNINDISLWNKYYTDPEFQELGVVELRLNADDF